MSRSTSISGVGTDYSLLANTALDKIKDFDGLYIHIKEPDIFSHDGDFNKKKESLEEIDELFVASLLKHCDFKNTVIAIAADHSTPCVLKAHSADPVPLVVCGPNIRPDGSLSFSEKAARLGSLGELMGQEIMPLIVKSARE